MKRKIGIIVQRYGKQVNGGSEVLARMLAEKLSLKNDVTVLTSRALDANTWEPVMPEGENFENGIRILRFNHKPKGNAQTIHKLNRRCRGRLPFQKFYRFIGRPQWYLKIFPDSEIKNIDGNLWLEKSGPATHDLLAYLKENESCYDAYIFLTYIYFPTAVGMPTVAHKSIFIPTMHDEQPAFFSVFQKLMECPRMLLFLTESEMRFSEKNFPISNVPKKVISVGIDLISEKKNPSVLAKFGIKGKYVLYVGRIEAHKGCVEMLIYFIAFLNKLPEGLILVLVGKIVLEPVIHPSIIYAGFIEEDDKLQLMLQAETLIMPSKHESLSLAVLESFACKVPVIANAECEVLKDHIVNSNGGWTYNNEEEFSSVLKKVIEGTENKQKGLNGYKYVTNNYSWQKAMKVFDDAIDFVIKANNKEEI